MSENLPSPTETNGRLSDGRFGTGNKFATGTHQSHVQKLRLAIVNAIDAESVTAIVSKVVELAKAGDLKAARLILDFVGRPDDAVVIVSDSQLNVTQLGPITPENLEERKQQLIAAIRSRSGFSGAV